MGGLSLSSRARVLKPRALDSGICNDGSVGVSGSVTADLPENSVPLAQRQFSTPRITPSDQVRNDGRVELQSQESVCCR